MNYSNVGQRRHDRSTGAQENDITGMLLRLLTMIAGIDALSAAASTIRVGFPAFKAFLRLPRR